ncbi:MAG: hypothetical protein EXS16_14630 [Gemmataceae bacterium]|nr:hypothetical protein [Gemmataceae bacterium]
MNCCSKILVLSFFAFLCAGLVSSQEGSFKKSKKDRRPSDEDAKMMKILERSFKLADTERDRFIRELVRLDSTEALRVDFKQWFARLSAGGTTWERGKFERQNIMELFDRAAMRLKLDGNTITRDQFFVYANRYLGSENSPYWREPKENASSKEIAKVFEHFDRDNDQFLKGDEIPTSLQTDLARWDKNGDGRIDSDEYRAYFPESYERVRQQMLNSGQGMPGQQPVETADPDTGIAPAKLPPGLPRWFAEVDRDRDGQIALFEWRKAGWPLDEFGTLDINDDGFLVPDEVLRLLATINRDGTQPFEYLMKKTTAKTSSSLAKKSLGGRK